jgi:hypothetical protein
MRTNELPVGCVLFVLVSNMLSVIKYYMNLVVHCFVISVHSRKIHICSVT